MTENNQSPWDRIDAAANERLAARLLLGVGAVGTLALAAGLIWHFNVGLPAHWLGYGLAILIGAGLASITGVLGIGIALTALAAFFFGLLGLLGGLVLTALVLLARR
ncbi:hypothetical protein [Mesorhizobium sp.]|uniref:hypothetical protein n=1 Tax=Mesorhizobium sp. TaxID=1871066 RepID=UPI000FE9FC42|nr:hypothetical protein [Mesorhizobium sp.]RWB68367.1 MAG: hypothetical protein EOQ49_22685 [Mesorhizobium sp.]